MRAYATDTTMNKELINEKYGTVASEFSGIGIEIIPFMRVIQFETGVQCVAVIRAVDCRSQFCVA